MVVKAALAVAIAVTGSTINTNSLKPVWTWFNAIWLIEIIKNAL